MRINLVRLVPENDIIRGRVFDDAVLPRQAAFLDELAWRRLHRG